MASAQPRSNPSKLFCGYQQTGPAVPTEAEARRRGAEEKQGGGPTPPA